MGMNRIIYYSRKVIAILVLGAKVVDIFVASEKYDYKLSLT